MSLQLCLFDIAQPEQPQPQPLTPVLLFLKNLKKCFPVYITQRSTMI
ncbi:hypothetical protein BACCOP_02926 [Phocaeicola coprocola DSM 17136]|uniref:Uncharacterized protein n=1 Tax=Phocaeicola coprocola DSM 17136 TaxID=470145 RepID=B3JLX5_9BACT|nr:hypothetical protein BACCOP_02926 [Phocaeicola coprocola DSM 17136]